MRVVNDDFGNPIDLNDDFGGQLNDDFGSPLNNGPEIPLHNEGVDPFLGNVSIEETVRAPYIGMEFDTLEMFDDFWEKYGRSIGFSVRIEYTYSSNSKKDKKTKLGRSYVCSRAGKKVEDKRRINFKRCPETRCECPVKLLVGFNVENRKYYVKSFKADHNHYLENNESVYLLRSHRSINTFQARAIDHASRAVLGAAAMHRVMAIEAGGTNRVGFTVQEIRSHLRSKRTNDLNPVRQPQS